MMKKWEDYKKYSFEGEWHIHTTFTDGKNTIFDYCKTAEELKIPLLAFTEHVRLSIDYDFDEYLTEIEKAREEFPNISILSGCEAKVLPDGKLDCCSEIIRECDYVLFAYHSFPTDLEAYLVSIRKTIKTYSVDAWAHPGLFMKKNYHLKIDNERLDEIFGVMKEYNILLEINITYNLPPKEWIDRFLIIVGSDRCVWGGDVHSIKEMIFFNNLKKRGRITNFSSKES